MMHTCECGFFRTLRPCRSRTLKNPTGLLSYWLSKTNIPPARFRLENEFCLTDNRTKKKRKKRKKRKKKKRKERKKRNEKTPFSFGSTRGVTFISSYLSGSYNLCPCINKLNYRGLANLLCGSTGIFSFWFCLKLSRSGTSWCEISSTFVFKVNRKYASLERTLPPKYTPQILEQL